MRLPHEELNRTPSPEAESHSFTVRNTHRGKTRGQVHAEHHEGVQGRELRGHENLKWNTDLIETMELEHVMSQAAQDRYDGETHHESREAQAHERKDEQWTKHAYRSDSQAQQPDLTSRGGVLVERVYVQRPHGMSTTTHTTQPQGLALCSRCHPGWASVAPQWAR